MKRLMVRHLTLPAYVCLIGMAACSDGPGPTRAQSSLGRSRSALTTAVSSAAGTWTAAKPIALITWPGAVCSAHKADDNKPTSIVQVFADDLGITRLAAAPATTASADSLISLDCSDPLGRTGTYTLDTSQEATFAPLSEPAPDPATIRPPLQGDPLSYSQEELLVRGYGIRPDPVEDPKFYQLWLRGAQATSREIRTPDNPLPFAANGSHVSGGGLWGGGMLVSATYTVAEYSFVIPTFYTCSGTCAGGGAFWGGLGGWTDYALIQDGIEASVNNSILSLDAWKCYWSGDGDGGLGYTSAVQLFDPSIGDTIYGQAYACDSSGNMSFSGGYACFYIQDYPAYGSYYYKLCNTPHGSCPSLPAINTFTGATAEAISEANEGPFAKFSNMSIYFAAYDSSVTQHDYSTDTYEYVDLENGSSQFLDTVTISSPETTAFVWDQGQ